MHNGFGGQGKASLSVSGAKFATLRDNADNGLLGTLCEMSAAHNGAMKKRLRFLGRLQVVFAL